MSDVAAAIVGGGPAGLAAALTLARAMQHAVVFDSPEPPRNAASTHIAAVIGRDGLSPADLRAAGRADVERYGRTRFAGDTVIAIDGDAADGFVVSTAAGERVRAAAVILACGMRDIFPPLDGLAAVWGRSVMNCPFCDGLEHAGGRWGVYANRTMMFDVAPIYRTWCEDLIVFCAPGIAPDDTQRAALAARSIGLEERAVAGLRGTDGVLDAVVLSDGAAIARDALVLWPFQSQTSLVGSLGLSLDADGFVTVDAGFRTSRPGIYGAGDLLYGGHQNINTAAHMGNLAAATLVLDRALG